MATTEIIQRGSKLFWKARTTIDVLLVDHKQLDVTEIVCSDPTTSQEAPRIYVRSSVLRGNICDDEIQSRMYELTEPILQRKGTISPIDKDILLAKVWKNALYEYVDERLELHKKLAGSKAFHVALRKPLFSEGSDAVDGVPLVCDAPPSLRRYELDHYTAPRDSILEENKDIVTADSAASAHTAHSHPETHLSVAVAATEIILSVRERWRIPIVLAKIMHSRSLNRGDARIWKVVASNLLADADMHERLAIANRESATMCADFAARVYIRMPAMSPIQSLGTSKSFARPPPIDTTSSSSAAATQHGRQSHTHPHSRAPSAQPSPRISPKVSPKPSTDRFTHPEPTPHGSFKFGIDALTSSLSRGLLSFGSNLDTKNKQYRAAAAADLDGTQQAQNTPKGLGLMKHHKDQLDLHGHSSSSTAGLDTPTSDTSGLHRRSVGASTRRHSRGTPRGGGGAGGLRSPLMNQNHATPRNGLNSKNTPRHQQLPQLAPSPMATGRDHTLTVGVVGVIDDSELTSKSGPKHVSSPDKQREWFAVSLSRKLAGLVGAAPSALASFTGSSSKNRVACEEEDDDAPDNGSVAADIADQDANDASFGQASSHGNLVNNKGGVIAAGRERDELEADDPSCVGFSGGEGKAQVNVIGASTPPHSRSNTMTNTTCGQNNATTSKTTTVTAANTPIKPSGGIGSAISNIINNLSGKHNKNRPSKSPKHTTIHTSSNTTHSSHSLHTTHTTHTTNHPHTPQKQHTDSSTPASPADGPVQKFFQLITLRGRNVVIRPAVTIKHDTVVQFY